MHRLLLLGGAFLEGPDGPLTGRAAQGHRLALLALLAAEHPRPLTRDRLIACLWPQSDSERGRRLLRHALHLLRAALGKDTLLSHGDELRLDPARLGCDLWEFREALERGDREAGVTAYGGPFLNGVYLDDAEEFERWVEVERSCLASCFAEALAALAEQHEAAGELRAAAAAWRRLSEQDPYNSHYALRLMQALETVGDRAGALRLGEMHSALLQTEFGAEPDPDIETLAMRLREQPMSLAAQPTSRCVTVSAGEAVRAEILPAEGSDARSAALRETPVPGAHVAQPVAPPGADGAMPRLGRRSAQPRIRALVLGSMLALGMLGVLTTGELGEHALALLGFGPPESLLSRGVLAERERILLADFTSPTGDTLLAGMATEAFRIDLAQSPILTLVEPQQIRAALGRMERSDTRLLDRPLAQELAAREGLKAVLVGEIVRSGSGYLLSARLLAAESGEILAAHREAVTDSTTLLPALDRLSKQLRRRIGESLRSVSSNAPLEQVTTSSLEALRKYSQAVRVLDAEGDDARGIELLEEAISLDSTFAMAYRALGVALVRRREQRARRIDAINRAYRHQGRLTDRERYRALETYYGIVTGEPEKAITALRTLLETYPYDVGALNNLGTWYFGVRNFPRAEESFRRAWEVDSTIPNPLMNLVVAQFNQGKVEEAEATFEHFAARFPDNWRVAQRGVNMAAAHGNYARAESLALAERQAWPEDLWRRAAMAERLARLASVRGRLEESTRYWLEQSELHRRRNQLDAAFGALIEIAFLDIDVPGRSRPALERVHRALEDHPLAGLPAGDRPYLFLARFYARMGQPDRARALLAEWGAAVPAEQRRVQESGQRRVFGEIALAERRPLDAVREFRLADQGANPIIVLADLGRAYDQAGQPDSVIAIYERFLGTPVFARLVQDASWRAPVLERLGQLHEARGDPARAAEHYRSFIELWHDADPELQPRVREARRRLAALQ
jgi:DNA-binding SARP family transcriptional activator/tetratricopeptide (TPR) repeat protein